MLERDYSLELKNNVCTIFEPNGVKLMNVKMKRKTFTLDWNEEESTNPGTKAGD